MVLTVVGVAEETLIIRSALYSQVFSLGEASKSSCHHCPLMGTGIGGGGCFMCSDRSCHERRPISRACRDVLLNPPQAVAVGEPRRGRWLCQLHAGLSQCSLQTHRSSGQSGTLVSG